MAIATPLDPVLQWPLSLPLLQLWNSVYSGKCSWKKTLSCLASVSLVSVNTVSSFGTVEPMTFHVNTVKVLQQGCMRLLPSSSSPLRRQTAPLCGLSFQPYVSDSVLACLTFRAFLVVFKLMLHSPLVARAFLCQQQCYSWLVAFALLSGCSSWLCYQVLVAALLHFGLRVALAKHACMLPGLWACLL